MAVGDVTNLGTPLEGTTGTTQAYPVGTVPAAPPNAGIIVGVASSDDNNDDNAACTDDRGNTYVRLKQESGSGITELNFFYSIGATALQNNDNITISGISDGRARVIGAAYVEGMGTLFGTPASATGTSTTPASGTIASMPDDTIVIGILGWSNQPSTGVFTTATQDADYASDIAGIGSNLGGAAGTDRAVFFGNRVISGGPVTDGYSPTVSATSLWCCMVAAFDPATGLSVVSPTQSHTVAALGLTQVHNLTTVGATAGSTATAPDVQLDTGDIVAVSAECGHEVSAPSMAQDGDIVAVDATFGHTVTSPRLVILDDDFESSALNVSGSSVAGSGDDAIITLDPRVQHSEHFPGATRHLAVYARITGLLDSRPTFVLPDYAATATDGTYHGAPWPTGRRMMFSYDTETWFHFDTNHTIGASTITFRHSTAFTGNVVYISWSRVASVTQTGTWIEGLETSFASLITTLPSTLGAGSVPAEIQSFPAQDFISDMFSATTDELARTVPETPFYGFKIQDDSLQPASGPKRTFVLTAGMHGRGEQNGFFVLKAAVEFILSADAQAQNIRQYANIAVYPCLSAPDVYGGHWRTTFQPGPGGETDPNRHFPETDTTLEQIDIPKAAFVTDLPSVVQVMLDFHGNFEQQRELRTTGVGGDAFYAAVDVYEGTIFDSGNSGASTIVLWFGNNYSSYIYTTSETGEVVPFTDAALTQWGESHAKALSDLIDSGDIPVTIEPQASTAGHTVSAPNITQVGDDLTVVSATVGHTVAAPSMTVTTMLTVVSAIQGHEATTASTSTLVGTITIVSCTMGHTVTAPGITTFVLGTTPVERTFTVANENRNLQVAASARELVA